MPINHKIFLAQFDTIKQLASEESCVIIGRCADYALAEFPNVVSYNYYSSKRWGDSKSYDLCINSSKTGADGAIKVIREFARIKQEYAKIK